MEETSSSIVTFLWLSYGRLPLVELLLGKKESFLPLAEGCKVVSLPVGVIRMSLPMGVISVHQVTHV